MSAGAAREHVRVARALRDLPVIRAEFGAGRLSYAKVRALTRIATAENEGGLAEIAGPMTGNQLERFARAHRQVSQADDAAGQRPHRAAKAGQPGPGPGTPVRAAQAVSEPSDWIDHIRRHYHEHPAA